MNARELIESGLLELYCIGGTSAGENVLIEMMINEDKMVYDELQAIAVAVESYAFSYSVSPPDHLLKKILDSITLDEYSLSGLPPLLSDNSSTEEWVKYIYDNNIEKPLNHHPINMIEMHVSPMVVTYIAWAENGAYLEESHADETERLLMLSGSCKIELNGSTYLLTAGDFIEIPAGTIHRAESTGKETMVVIGQRLAA